MRWLVVASIFGWLADLAKSTWAYAIAPAVILVDTFVGFMPAETVLHAAGVGAAQGDISVVVVIALAILAAIVADFLLYTVATKGSGRVRRFVIRGDRSRKRYEQTCRQLRERSWLVTVARFVPGLRTVTMVAAGTTRMARRRFFTYEVPGAILWGSYNVLIGYILGMVFEQAGFWLPVLVSAAIAAALAGIFELVRRARLQPSE